MKIEEIIIDPEFQSMIPPLADAERTQLGVAIERDGGFRDALVVWMEHGILLDGHHRLALYRERYENDPMPPPVIMEISLSSRDAARQWMARNQLGRRNLPDFARAELALLLEPEIKAKAKERQTAGVPSTLTEGIDTREEVAKAAGVSTGTISKVKAIKADAPPEIVEAVRAGEISIHKAHQSIAGANVKPAAEPTARKQGELPVALCKAVESAVSKWPTDRLDEFTGLLMSHAGEAVAVAKKRRGT